MDTHQTASLPTPTSLPDVYESTSLLGGLPSHEGKEDISSMKGIGVEWYQSTVREDVNYISLFYEFLTLGMLAWGGPFAQIAMLKEKFVENEKILSLAQFNRVQGVYQLCPGPEATELCCYFGILRGGKRGGLIAGFAFVLPGAILMLLLSFVYTRYGINPYIHASFRGVQPAVASMMIVAVHRIGQHALLNQETRKLDWQLLMIALVSAMQFVFYIHFLFTLALAALWYFLFKKQRFVWLALLLSLAVVFVITCIAVQNLFSTSPDEDEGIQTVTPLSLFLLGLKGGLFSVGGAYSAVPFMEAETTHSGHWMTKQQFLDALALSAIIPAPMVIFSLFVGFIGGQQLLHLPQFVGELVGAFFCTCGMFFPAFTITIFCHDLLNSLVQNPHVSSLWDGITSAVVGLVAVTAVQFTKATVGDDPLAALTVVGACAILFLFQHAYLPTMIVAIAAMLGQVYYAPRHDL